MFKNSYNNNNDYDDDDDLNAIYNPHTRPEDRITRFGRRRRVSHTVHTLIIIISYQLIRHVFPKEDLSGWPLPATVTNP